MGGTTLQHTWSQGCAGTWPALVCTFCSPQLTSSWEQPPATTPGFTTSPSPLPTAAHRLFPPSDRGSSATSWHPPKPDRRKKGGQWGWGVSPYPFLPDVTTSSHCSNPKQRFPFVIFSLLHPSHPRSRPRPALAAASLFQPRPARWRARGDERAMEKRGPGRRAASPAAGSDGAGFLAPPPAPHRSPGVGGGESGLPARGSRTCAGKARSRPAVGRSVRSPCKTGGEGGRVVGGSPGLGVMGVGGDGRPLSSPPLGPPPPPPPEAPACCCLPRWRRPPRPGGTWRRGRPAGGACGLGSRIIPPAAGRCLAGRRAGGGAARRAGGAAAWPPAAAGRQRSPPAGPRRPGPGPAAAQRSAAPLPRPRPARRRAGRAAVGGPRRRRGGGGDGRDGDGDARAGRWVTLRRRRQAGGERARCGRSSGVPPGAELPSGRCRGVPLPAPPRVGGGGQAGRCGREGFGPGRGVGGEVRGPVGFAPLGMMRESSEDQECSA